jgi:hypothetical protein
VNGNHKRREILRSGWAAIKLAAARPGRNSPDQREKWRLLKRIDGDILDLTGLACSIRGA